MVNKKWDSEFRLGDSLTDEQLSFFDKHGVIVFRNFLPKEKVATCISELKRIEKQWIDEGREKVNGIPLKYGKDDDGNTIIQRLCFSSLYSEALHDIVQDPKLKLLFSLLAYKVGSKYCWLLF